MSAATSSYIYTGNWINWSRGAVSGATITLTQRNGGLLTAFLGIFVTFTGAAFWRLLSFLIHQRRATKRFQDAVHHQQQAILRNSETAGGAAWQMTRVAWQWRTLARSPVLRSLPFILLAICNMLLFTVAGVFSSEVTKAAGNETLIRSPNCGFWSISEGTDTDPLRDAKALAAERDTLTASTYSRACYRDAQDNPQCKRLPQPRIPFKSRRGVPCPFESQICAGGPTAAFEIDSDLIDSHKDLGINSKQSERVHYRKVTTCAVLNQAGRVDTINLTGFDGGVIPYGRYYYGATGNRNFTSAYNRDGLDSEQGYTIASFFSRAGESDYWTPARVLSRTDADISIFFLASNLIHYAAPVFDPWMRATIPGPRAHIDGSNFTVYRADMALGVLACTDQFQICNPVAKRCTALVGQIRLPREVDALGLSQIQLDTAKDIYQTVLAQLTYLSVNNRGASALRASDTVSSLYGQVELPDNQWTLEVTEWFAVSMAKLQQKVVDYATGPSFVRDGLKLSRGKPKICQ